ncbi:MAG TPA: M48 family metallopeptidase [Trichocoleus sp.]|jgi:Zn-dependent protease with chaperone function
MALTHDLIHFPDISYRAFQHSTDAEALAKLKAVPGLSKLLKELSHNFAERWYRVAELPRCIEVTSSQYPSLWKQYIRMTEALSIFPAPRLFIKTFPAINAFTFGGKEHFIVLYSGLIDLLTEDELLAVIGHELGHIKCQHITYSSIAQLLSTFGTGLITQLFPVPGLNLLLSMGTKAKLYDWYRKAELSCDRAALLATQDEDIVCSMLAKLCGYSKNLKDEINVEAVKDQAMAFENLNESIPDWVFKAMAMFDETHPYPSVRVRELSNWSLSQDYFDIFEGRYPEVGVDELLDN